MSPPRHTPRAVDGGGGDDDGGASSGANTPLLFSPGSFVALRRSIDSALRAAPFANSRSPFEPRADADACSAAPAADEHWGDDGGSAAAAAAAAAPCASDDQGPPTWAEAAAEARRLLSMTAPLTLQALSTMLLTLVSTVFVGHLNDPVALSGVVLASSVFNVTGVSLIIGLSSALDTLCGQAYGAKAYPLLGAYLVRARLICWSLCVPVALLYSQAEPLLLAIGQEPAIAAVAARYLHMLVPSLFLAVVTDTCRRYLLAQRVVVPGMLASVATTCLSPVYNYTFIRRMGLRTDGAALAVLACQATNCALIGGFRIYRDHISPRRRGPEATFAGFDPKSALRGWGAYLKLGIPAAAMICFEWWVWELCIMFAGWLPNADVAVSTQGIAMQVSSMFYMLPASLGSATATRVANSLGAGNARGAALVFRVALAVGASLGLASAAAIASAAAPLARLFTGDAAVVAAASQVLPYVAASLLGDAGVAVLSCVLRAAGRQALGAGLNIVSYWAVGLPLALVAAFPLGRGVAGMWGALALAAALQACVFMAVIARFDWAAEVARARRLTQQGAASHPGALRAAGAGEEGSEGADGRGRSGGSAKDVERGDLRQPLLPSNDAGGGTL